jgi:AcrR family transcriptional regulator
MRGFSDEERERIRDDLLDAGRELFARYGLEKTTVAELTDAVGIGTSTFYRFFDSKEDLYVAVLEAEGEAVARRLEGAGLDEVDDPREAVERFLTLLLEEVEANPLVRRLVVEPGTRERLRRSRSEAERAADREADVRFVRSLLDPFVEAGRVRGDDPELVANAVAAVPYLALHREEIGEERYPEVMRFVVETFARGLAADGDGEDGEDGEDGDDGGADG